jgi:ribokinase
MSSPTAAKDITHTSTSTSTKRKIIIAGSSNYDLTAYTPIIPKLGETVIGSNFLTCPGGKGANQAVAAAKLLFSNPKNVNDTDHDHDASTNNYSNDVHMITRVGNDVYGTALLQNFDSVHVNYNKDNITLTSTTNNNESDSNGEGDNSERNTHTGVAQILVDTESGDNTIVVIPGANMHLTSQMVRNEIEEILLGTNTDASNSEMMINNDEKNNEVVIMTQLEIPISASMEAMKIGQQYGATTILNPAPAPTKDSTAMSLLQNEEFYQNIDILIPNETELRSLFNATIHANAKDVHHGANSSKLSEQEMAQELLKKGVRRAVVVTLGSRGAMVVQRRDNHKDDIRIDMVLIPSDLPYHDQPVQDTVGAGDCFCGALGTYLASGLDLVHATEKACGVASMSVRKRGAQDSYPLQNELSDFLRISF